MAAKLQCEICGGKLIGKPGGIFECDSCGMEYDTAWAKAKIQEITGTVKVEGQVEVTGKVQIENGGPGSDSLFRRAELYLEDRKWREAVEYFDKVLDIQPENAMAHLMREMAEKKCATISELAEHYFLFNEDKTSHFSNAVRFADEKTREQLELLEQSVEQAKEAREKKYLREQQEKAEDPTARKLRQDLASKRKKADCIEKHVIASKYHTFSIDTEGRISCTPVLDDEYNIFNNGKNACETWGDLYPISAFMENVSNVFGIKAEDGTLVCTRTRDGKVKFVNWPAVQNWRDLQEIEYAGYCGLFCGLRRDGTFVAAGEIDPDDYHGQDKAEHFSSLAKMPLHFNGRLIGLRTDGTLMATEFIGDDDTSGWDEMSSWNQIVDIVKGADRVVGFKQDGSMTATRYLGKGEDKTGWTEASAWRDIVQLFALDSGRYVGLTAYGKPMITMKREDAKEDDSAFDVIASWKNIVKLYKIYGYIVGLTLDGKAVHTAFSGDKQYDYPEAMEFGYWDNIAAMSFGYRYTVAVKTDGQFRATSLDEEDSHGSTHVWNLGRMFKNYDKVEEEYESLVDRVQEAKRAEKLRIETERKAAAERAEAERRAAAERAEAERKAAAERAEAERRAAAERAEAERKAAAERAEAERKAKIAALSKEKAELKVELPTIKGLFSGGKRRQVEARLAEIEAELTKLG